MKTEMNLSQYRSTPLIVEVVTWQGREIEMMAHGAHSVLAFFADGGKAELSLAEIVEVESPDEPLYPAETAGE